MNQDQEKLRQRLIFYLANEQVKQKIICERTSIPQDVLSKFKNGQKFLYLESAEQLDLFLGSKNY